MAFIYIKLFEHFYIFSNISSVCSIMIPKFDTVARKIFSTSCLPFQGLILLELDLVLHAWLCRWRSRSGRPWGWDVMILFDCPWFLTSPCRGWTYHYTLLPRRLSWPYHHLTIYYADLFVLVGHLDGRLTMGLYGHLGLRGGDWRPVARLTSFLTQVTLRTKQK